MLIINILLILLFFIILFYDRRIIEGQSSNYTHLMDYTINDFYNTVVDSILNIKLDNSEINKYIFEDKITCKNSENRTINATQLKQYTEQISKNDNNNSNNNSVTNKNINNFFGYLGIEFTNNNFTDNNSNIKKVEDEKNTNNQIHLCDLVPMIYDENTSASLVSKITSSYGNCYDIEDPETNLNTINEFCKRDCSLIDYKINDCSIFQPVNINSCNQYKGDKDKIFFKKENGVYYNCEKNDQDIYEKKVCRPNNDIICNFNKTDLLKSCEETLNTKSGKKVSNKDHAEYSSSSYKLDNGETILKSINCQYDEKNNKVIDIIDNNILHCQNNMYGFEKYAGVCY